MTSRGAPPAGPTAEAIFRGFNVWLTLELTNTCNLRCAMCDIRRHDPLPPGFMDPELFRAILGELSARGLSAHGLKLFWLGEPLLHPAFPELLLAIDPAAVNGTVVFDTNCQHLDEAVCEALVERCRDCKVYIFLSLDAFTSETYRDLRVGGERDRAYANVRRLLELRRRRGRDFPKVRLQFIVHPRNRGEARAFVEYWRAQEGFAGLPVMDRVQDDRDFIHLRRLVTTPDRQAEADLIYAETLAGLGVAREAMPANVDQRRCDEGGFPCENLFSMPMVRWNGEVTVCNNDLELALRVGDARTTPFLDIWAGEAANRLRRQHLFAARAGVPKCASCAGAQRAWFPESMAAMRAALEGGEGGA